MKMPEMMLFDPEKIVKQLIKFADFCISQKGYFRLILAGGNTPKQVYEILEQKQPDSSKWELFFGDERDLPINHLDRNSTMVEKTMPQLIKKARYYPISNAKDYDNLIAQKMPFDLVLLGVGEDGHTASVFPNKTYTYLDHVQIIEDAPKPPPRRISLSINTLNNTQQTWVFMTGESKKNILKQWLNHNEDLPITSIKPIEKLTLFGGDSLLSVVK